MDDPDYSYRGTFTEIGASLALKKPLVVVCPDDEKKHSCTTNCFFHHPNIMQVQTLEEAMNIVRTLQEAKRREAEEQKRMEEAERSSQFSLRQRLRNRKPAITKKLRRDEEIHWSTLPTAIFVGLTFIGSMGWLLYTTLAEA
jgi:hypothetical protein